MLAKELKEDVPVEGPDAKVIKVKGTNVYHMIQFLRIRFGKLAYERLRAEFEKNTGMVIDERALMTGWTTLEFQTRLAAEALDLSPEGPRPGQEEILKEMISYIAKMEASTTLVKMFLKIYGVEKMLGKLMERWNSLFSVGKWEVVHHDSKERVIILRLTDFGEQPWHFWMSIRFFVEELVGAFGTRDVLVVHRQLRKDGVPYQEFEIRWDR